MVGMPSQIGKKRKREESTQSSKAEKPHGPRATTQDDIQSEILLLESAILESRKNYNSISTLLEYAQALGSPDSRDVCAAVALCRIFCRLLVLGKLTKTGVSSEDEILIIRWLRERLQAYETCLIVMLQSSDPTRQRTAVTLLMRTMKERAKNNGEPEDSIWRVGSFVDTVTCLATKSGVGAASDEFVSKYVEQYDDVRFHLFSQLA